MSEEFEGGIVTVTDDDGQEHRFEMLDAIETEEGRFVALLPLYDRPEESLAEDNELIVLQVTSENGEDLLCPIEDETLFDEIAGIFEERLEDLYDIEDADDEALGESEKD